MVFNALSYFKIIFVITLFFIFEKSLAQIEARKFGDVSIQDFSRQRCEFDTAASAAILFDVVNQKMGAPFKYERHIRIKFFKNTKINEWANVSLKYLNQTQSISDLRCATYNLENGNIVALPVSKENIFHRKVTKKIKEVSFAFPQVRAGSIVEYSYKLSANADMAMASVMALVFGIDPIETTWQFENEIPVYRADFFYNGPLSTFYLQGLHQENVKLEENNVLHWFVQNVPSFRSEEMTPEKDELIGKLFIDLSNKTWSQVGKIFKKIQQYGLTGRDSLLVKQFAAKFLSIPDPKTKVDSVVKYVKRAIKWNGEYDLIPDREFADVFVAKTGSSCEINLIINAILNKAKIKSHPVLISNRGHGKVSSVRPRARQFNNLITCVVGEDQNFRLLDGTERTLPIDFIPFKCLNGNGLLIDGDNSYLIPLKVPRSKKSLSANLYLSEKPEAEIGQMEIAFLGLPASYERQKYDSIGEQKYKQALTTNYPLMSGEVLIHGAKDGEEPFKVHTQIHGGDLFTFSNDLIYVNPFEVDRIKSGDFLNSESRAFPIDLGSQAEQTFVFKIELPKSSQVVEIPKPVVYSLLKNSARFSYSISQRENILFVSSQLLFNRTVFEPVEFHELKEFYKLIFNKQSEPIVIKKNF